MPKTYDEIFTYAHKRFSARKAARTAVPTVLYKLRKPALPQSDKITLFTSTIFPPLAILWHHCVRKAFGDRVETVIFDCLGNLKPSAVPGAHVQKYLNFGHSKKIADFLHAGARQRRLVWICDDDVFPMSSQACDIVEQELAAEKTATVSFRPRYHWHFTLNEQTYQPSGSYCLAINREIFVDREGLDPHPADGNVHTTHRRKRYDTLDRSNEELLKRGYRCTIVPEAVRNEVFAGFDGTSIAAFMLDYFRTPAETLAYLQAPDDDKWRGNTLHRILNALLAACSIREIHAELTGTQYPFPSLPERGALEEVRHRVEPLLTEGRSFTVTDETTDRLRAFLLG